MFDDSNHYLQKSPNAQSQPILSTKEEHFPMNWHVLCFSVLKCRPIGWSRNDFFNPFKLL